MSPLLFLVFVASPYEYGQTVATQDSFLSAPFVDSQVAVWQGFQYDTGDIHHHNGAIDYFLQNRKTGEPSSFDVIAAADGVAMWDDDPDVCPDDEKGPCIGGLGNVVIIRHHELDANGNHYFTLYAHLENGSIPDCAQISDPQQFCIKKLSRGNANYGQWREVTRGAKVGNAGGNGDVCQKRIPTGQGELTSCIHLHFEVFKDSFLNAERWQSETDPYDISHAVYPVPVGYIPESYYTRSKYPGGAAFSGCGSSFLWVGRSEHEVLDGKTVEHIDGTLIKAADAPTVYLLENGEKRPIASLQTLHTLYGVDDGFDIKDVILVGSDELSHYTLGSAIESSLPGNGGLRSDGHLIKAKGKGEIGVISKGLLRPFPSPEIFFTLGYLICNVEEVDPSQYDSYSVNHLRGAPISGLPELSLVTVKSTLDGVSWSSGLLESISYSLQGPGGPFVAPEIPATINNALPGDYTLTFNNGGPVNGALIGIQPCELFTLGPQPCTATSDAGGTLTFTLEFRTNPNPVSCTLATIPTSVTPGGHATLSWTTNGGPTAGIIDSGIGPVDLSKGSVDTPALSANSTFTLTVSRVGSEDGHCSATVAAGSGGNGWRMSGYNGSRTNNSPAFAPSTLPTFSVLASDTVGSIQRIANDGSLLLFSGSSLSLYSNSGVFRWSQLLGGSASDVAIGPDGTIYTSTPTSLSAWNKDTGRPDWSVAVNSGNETSALAIDAGGIIYMMSGASYVGPPNKISAIKPDGTLKWEVGGNFRGYSQFVLSTDESIGYFLDLTGSTSWERGIATQTGADVYAATFIPRNNTYAFAPWNSLYMAGGDGFSDFLLDCGFSLTCAATNPDARGVSTTLPAGVLIVGRTDGRLMAINRTGSELWVAPNGLSGLVSDAGNRVFGIVAATNDLVALDGLTGTELWRRHFEETLRSVLVGDDGSLFVSAGNTLYKSSAGVAPACTSIALRLYSVDDLFEATMTNSGMEDEPILSASYLQDTGPVDISAYTRPGGNNLYLRLRNFLQGWTYGYQLFRDSKLVEEAQCGATGSFGCKNNDSTLGEVFTRKITFQCGP